jgi:hypothetical protein
MFYLFLLAHLAADFMFQPSWLVARKQRWDGLLIHGAIVLVCMAVLPLFDASVLALWPLILGITVVHALTDWWKVRYGSMIVGPPIVPFLLDQLIHIVTLMIGLGLVLPSDRMWSLAASPTATLALCLAAYVVAAFATPIAVMIWLDPCAKEIAQAGKARLRSLFVGAGVVSLVLFGGALALPATLLGAIVFVRRPRSTHPLDAPVGLMSVLVIGATMGVLLMQVLSL